MKARTPMASDINPETGEKEWHELPTVGRLEWLKFLESRLGKLSGKEADWADRAAKRGWTLIEIVEEIRKLRRDPSWRE